MRMADIQDCDKDFLNQVKTTLSRRKRKVIEHPHYDHAAVLVPLFKKEGACHLLFTKRTLRVKTHKGEISFPGGMVDQGDSGLEDTALRETTEEIGLKKEDIQVVGMLDDIMTFTGFIITPFVGYFSYPYPFKLSQYEIEELLEVPLVSLLKEAFPDGATDTGEIPRDNAYQFGNHTIWGATAWILNQFLDLIASSKNNLGSSCR